MLIFIFPPYFSLLCVTKLLFFLYSVQLSKDESKDKEKISVSTEEVTNCTSII